MRKLVVIEFITLDGVMQAPGGPEEDTSGGFRYGGWSFSFFDDEAGKVMNEQMLLKNVALLLGRKTYEIFAKYWPQHADGWPGINEVTKYVVSSNASLPLPWEHSELITSDVVATVKKLKTETGPDLHVWGSGELVQTLLKHDLVDELWLKIFPITLGSGKRLFADGTMAAGFKLTKSMVTSKGIIFANYERAGDVQTGSFE